MTDVYTFECDLDRDLPEDERAGLNIHDDGEHIVFGLAGGLAANREIYLTPDMAGKLASLLGALTGDQGDDTGERPPAVRLVATIAGLAMCLGSLAGLAYGAVFLFALL